MVEHRNIVTSKETAVCLRCHKRKTILPRNISGATGWILQLGKCRCENDAVKLVSSPPDFAADKDDSTTSGTNATIEHAVVKDDVEPAEIPKLIDDRYEVLQKLGTGGMGAVYKVKDLTLGGTFALKLLHKTLIGDPAVLKRFEQEATAAEQLDHENIVPTYAHGMTHDGQAYLVSELVEGETLAQIIEREGALEEDRAISIFQQVCNALDHAHEKRIVHRDIKPANILVSRMDSGVETVRLVDFGIAKTLPAADRETRDLTQTGEVFGSPHYMSPEQCLGFMLDERSDIYSLGCVMFEALSGKPPFAGTNPIQLVVSHINDKPKPYLGKFGASQKAHSLQSIALACLEKEASFRFQTVIELAESLERVKNGQRYRRNTSVLQNSKAVNVIHGTAVALSSMTVITAILMYIAITWDSDTVISPLNEESIKILLKIVPYVTYLLFPSMLLLAATLCCSTIKLASRRHWWATLSFLFTAIIFIGVYPTMLCTPLSELPKQPELISNFLKYWDYAMFGGWLIAVGATAASAACVLGFADSGPRKIKLKDLAPKAVSLSAWVVTVSILMSWNQIPILLATASYGLIDLPSKLSSGLDVKLAAAANYLAPNNANVLAKTATVFLEADKYDKAITQLNALLKNTKADSIQGKHYIRTRAYALMASGNFSGAIADYSKLLENNTDESTVLPDYVLYSHISACYLKENNLSEAIANADASLSIEPNSRARWHKMNAQLLNDDLDGAIATLQDGMKLRFARKPQALVTKGYLESLRHNTKQANSDYVACTTVPEPEYPYWTEDFARSVAYFQLGKQKEAVSEFIKARDSNTLPRSGADISRDLFAFPKGLLDPFFAFIRQQNINTMGLEEAYARAHPIGPSSTAGK